MKNKLLRTLQATIAPSSIRIEQFEGREHIVIPIIALIGNSVITAVGSDGPEFVPADELAKLPLGWNYRPTVIDHPPEGSANTPEILERQATGSLFNSTFDDNKLKFESWNDVAKMTSQGGESAAMLERIRALQAGTSDGDVIEVSVGLSMKLEGPGGIHEGKPYVGRWAEIVPDHLALLPRGTMGACNEQMGCGVRTAKDGNVDRLHRLILAFTDKGKSDSQIRNELDRLIRALSPSEFGDDLDSFEIELWGVDDVFQQSSTAISMLWTPSGIRFFRHKFNTKDDTISLTGKPEEVEPSSMKFETLSSELLPPTTGDTNVCTRIERITARLLRDKHFAKDQELALLAMSEDVLISLEDNMNKPADDVPPVDTTATPPIALVPDIPVVPAVVADVANVPMISVPESEWNTMQSDVAAFKTDVLDQQTQLVEKLTGKTGLSVEQLKTMNNVMLRALCTTAATRVAAPAAPIGKPAVAAGQPAASNADYRLTEPAATEPRRASSKPDTYASLRPATHQPEVN